MTAHATQVTQAELDAVAAVESAHAGLTVSAHGGIVAEGDARLSDERVPTDGSVSDAKIDSGGLSPAKVAGTAVVEGDSRLVVVSDSGRGMFAELRSHIDVSQVDPVAGAAPTAALAITTYVGGNNEITHPDVVYVPSGWNGYRYWMIATPYEGASSIVENPSLYCSDDGLSWVTPPGVTNPVVAPPVGGVYNSDNDMVLVGDTLYVFWRVFAAGNMEELWVKSTIDGGLSWSVSTRILLTAASDERNVSPGVVFDGSTWWMWTVDIVPSPNKIYVRTASSPVGPWSTKTEVTGLAPKANRDLWHLDAYRYGDQFVLLIVDVTLDGSDDGDLYLATSRDGLAWTQAAKPLLTRPSWATAFYRSTMVLSQIGDGLYARIWAGLVGAAPGSYKIGYTEAPVNAHRALTQAVHGLSNTYHLETLLAKHNMGPYVLGEGFDRADDASGLGTSDSGTAWSASTGTLGISGHRAYATAATNSRAYIETGLADAHAEVEITAADLTQQSWLIFRFQDATNYLRFGHLTSTLRFQSIVAGSATDLAGSSGFGSFAAGDRLGAKYSGTSVTLYQNGAVVWTGVVAALTAATKVGIQTNAVAERFDNLTVRSL